MYYKNRLDSETRHTEAERTLAYLDLLLSTPQFNQCFHAHANTLPLLSYSDSRSVFANISYLRTQILNYESVF